jgi:hypothetical protein
MRELQAALDDARRAQGLTWVALTAEINKPFEGTSSIPISVSSIRGMENKRSVTSAVVLQILRWLGRTPESFLVGTPLLGKRVKSCPSRGQAALSASIRAQCTLHSMRDASSGE